MLHLEGTKVDESSQAAPEAATKALPGDEDLNPAQREINHELHEEGSFLGYENPPRKNWHWMRITDLKLVYGVFLNQ